MIPLHKKITELTWGDVLTDLDERYGNQNTLNTVVPSNVQVNAEFMGVAECALLTGYKPDYIRQLVFKRAIPFHKNPRLKPLRFKRSEILAWMATKKFSPIDEQAEDYLAVKSASKKKTVTK